MKKFKALFQIVIILASIFTISLLNTDEVSSAIEPGDGCCELTNDGSYCVSTDVASCGSSSYQVGTDCRATTFCAVGCCWDPQDGEYSPSTYKATCEADGGLFDAANPSCENIPALEEGCCQLPSGCSYVTRTSCRAAITDLTELTLTDVFRTDIESEYECESLCDRP